MNADGGDQVHSPTAPADDQDPSWSSDGTQMAFETKRDTPTVGDQAEIYVTAADGSDQRNVTNRPGLDIHPATVGHRKTPAGLGRRPAAAAKHAATRRPTDGQHQTAPRR